MTVVYAAAMIALVVAPLCAIRSARLSGALAALGCAALVIVGLTAALDGPRPVLELGGWLGFGDSALRADGLGGSFLALTGVTGLAVSLAYVERAPRRLETALHGVLVLCVAIAVGASNGFLFFLAWEGLGLCVYLFGGYFAGGLTKLGGGVLLAAFGLLYGHTGSLDLAVWAQGDVPGIVFVLLICAFATKIGLVPLHGALPAGYGSAPGLGAASLSVALCAGYYGLWRFVFELRPPTWIGHLLLIVGAITALLGILYALTRDDLRRFLGFSTVEHAGIAAVGLGVGVLGQAAGNQTLAAAGLLAATLHVVAHGVAKTLALIAVDRVDGATGERGLDRLGGLGRSMPVEAGALGVASLTLAAVPPLGGFVSEWFVFEALLQSFRLPGLLSPLLCALAAAALALTAGLGLLAFAKLFGFAFLGPPRAPLERRRLAWPTSLVALGAVGLLLGALAPWEIQVLGGGLAGVLGFDPSGDTITHPLTLGPVFRDFSVLAPTWLALILPAYALLAAAFVGRRAARRAPVWVTGSDTPLALVQYRPSAYSNPIRVVLRGLLGFRRAVIGDRLETSVVLATDRFVYRPAARLALGASALARRTQSGSLSTYLTYMLAALILVLVLVPALN